MIKLVWEISLKNVFDSSWMETKNGRRYSAKTFKLLKRLVTKSRVSNSAKSEFELAKNRRVLFFKRQRWLCDSDLWNTWSFTPYSTLHEKRHLWKLTQLFCICRKSCLSRIDTHIRSLAKHSWRKPLRGSVAYTHERTFLHLKSWKMIVKGIYVR